MCSDIGQKVVGANFALFAYSGLQVEPQSASQQYMMKFKRKPKEFLQRFVIVDETWIRWYISECKEQSKPWTSHAEPTPEKVRTDPATLFWDS